MRSPTPPGFPASDGGAARCRVPRLLPVMGADVRSPAPMRWPSAWVLVRPLPGTGRTGRRGLPNEHSQPAAKGHGSVSRRPVPKTPGADFCQVTANSGQQDEAAVVVPRVCALPGRPGVLECVLLHYQRRENRQRPRRRRAGRRAACLGPQQRSWADVPQVPAPVRAARSPPTRLRRGRRRSATAGKRWGREARGEEARGRPGPDHERRRDPPRGGLAGPTDC